MRHNEYLDTKCKKCKQSLNWQEDALSLDYCFFCRQEITGLSIPSSNKLFPLSIKELIKHSKLMDTREISIIGKVAYFDSYQIEVEKEKFIFFGVIRGSYERITWMSFDEAVNFCANSVIDEVIRDEKESK